MRLVALIFAFGCSLTATSALSDSLGTRNFRELLAFYSVVTGVDSLNQAVQQAYATTRARLPQSGVVDEISSPSVLAATELAGAFCAQAVALEKPLAPARRTLFRRVNFAAGVNQHADADRVELVQHLTGRFWQRRATASEAAEYTALITEVAANPASAPDLELAMLALCISVGTSLDALLL